MNLEDLFKILDNVYFDNIRSAFRNYIVMENKYDLEKLRKFCPLNEDEALYFVVIAFLRFYGNIMEDLVKENNE